MNEIIAGGDLVRLLLVLVTGAAALLITQRSLTSLITIYAAQSALLVVIALLLYVEEGLTSLLAMALLTLVSKVLVIPWFLKRLLAAMPIKRDLEFAYLSPISSLAVSGVLFFTIYEIFSRFSAVLEVGPLFTLGAVIGVSLALMGMMVIMSRKKVVTKIIGYLSMENGVLLFSMFIAEMPFIIEVLIIVDLLMIIVLSAILAFGIDSSVEAFHKRLNQLGMDFEE